MVLINIFLKKSKIKSGTVENFSRSNWKFVTNFEEIPENIV